MTRAELERDQEKYREAYTKTLADANAIKGCLQYIESKLAELPDETRIILPGPHVPAHALKPR